MKTPNSKSQLLVILSLFAIFILSNGRTITSNNELIRAVNLGGWLVAEGWMKPSLFDSIPNKDFLDGLGLQFKSATTGKFIVAELGGGTIIAANRTSASGWETFRLWRINETSFHLRVFSKQFLGIESPGNKLVATSTDSEKSGIFEIIRKSDDSNRVRIKAPNGLFLQAKSEDLVTADSNGDGQWGDDDASVFEMTIVDRFQGEYQVTNGYGPLKAPQVMKDHWNTFIVEKDFSFIASSGLNAVRIPVGWWTTKDPTPPKPYVGGSLKALDRAFLWAKKYKLKVILDLHAAPGSQNGFEHSSTRDGSLEWGQTEETIEESVRVIEFYTSRNCVNTIIADENANLYVSMKKDGTRATKPTTSNTNQYLGNDNCNNSNGSIHVLPVRGNIVFFCIKDHWNTFIEEKDFSFIASSGLNAVRIPVGWWTTKDPTPPKPYVGGSLKFLDRAFLWANKYKLKVILDLHAAPGSQNGFDHTSTRDGSLEWGQSEVTIEETVRAIEFYTSRYATFPSLYAVELINEPRAPGVSLSTLTKYYDADYKAVRKHAPNVFIILSNRLSGDSKELFPLASGMKAVVIDFYYYNLFSDFFNDMTVDQNINFIQTNCLNDIQETTTSNGPPTFVGEWVAEWQVRGATKEEYQRFSEAQLKVWGRASFGWAYWSLKNVNNHWSMDWMIKNGYINL